MLNIYDVISIARHMVRLLARARGAPAASQARQTLHRLL
jgi:hypothetical protein